MAPKGSHSREGGNDGYFKGCPISNDTTTKPGVAGLCPGGNSRNREPQVAHKLPSMHALDQSCKRGLDQGAVKSCRRMGRIHQKQWVRHPGDVIESKADGIWKEICRGPTVNVANQTEQE